MMIQWRLHVFHLLMLMDILFKHLWNEELIALMEILKALLKVRKGLIIW